MAKGPSKQRPKPASARGFSEECCRNGTKSEGKIAGSLSSEEKGKNTAGARYIFAIAVTIATNVQVYFCEPRSPWQRGSNENTNGLLRQYFPRATVFSSISQRHLNAIALRLIQRPRKTLGFETPADRLQKVLH